MVFRLPRVSQEKGHHMARKPNYEFERRERARLKALKNAEKAAAKKEARDRDKAAAAADAPPKDEPTDPA